MNLKALAKKITDELMEADAKGVPGTLGMPAMLGGDLCDPRPDLIEKQILKSLRSHAASSAAQEKK